MPVRFRADPLNAVASHTGMAYREHPRARVAQLDRVTASEAAGCGFNSRHAHQFGLMLFGHMKLI